MRYSTLARASYPQAKQLFPADILLRQNIKNGRIIDKEG